MITSLLLPVLLSAVALFFASFLSWMVLKLHAKDWVKLEKEDEFLGAAKEIKPGNYMFPHCGDPKEMKSEAFQKKMKEGPNGVITVFGNTSMGRNLGGTFVYFLVISFCIAYVATLALDPGAAFEVVFRVVSTVGLLIFLAAIVQHAIWFHIRIVGHIIESILYAAIVGAIFGALWPAA